MRQQVKISAMFGLGEAIGGYSKINFDILIYENVSCIHNITLQDTTRAEAPKMVTMTSIGRIDRPALA